MAKKPSPLVEGEVIAKSDPKAESGPSGTAAAPVSTVSVIKPSLAPVAAPGVRSVIAIEDVKDAADLEGFETGLENVTSRDVIIPRLTLLQGLSPQLNKNKSEYIEGAAAGDFCDVSTGEIFKGSIHFLPVYFATIYLEWGPVRGKGLIANHGLSAKILEKCKRDELGRNVTKEGNFIAETATYYGLNLSAGGRRSFIPLSSTQLKNSRKWMTLITNERVAGRGGKEFTPPIFYRSWKASIVGESNAKGDWNGWKFTPDKDIITLDPSKNLLAEAKAFFEDARSGLVKGDLSTYADDGTYVPGNEDDKNEAM